MNRRARLGLLLVVALVGAMPSAKAVVLTGDDDSEVLFGTTKKDSLDAEGGNDYLFGKQNPKDKRDVLKGGNGADTLMGGSGPDTIDGESNNDQLFDGDDRPGDRLRGGDGDDVLMSADGARDSLDCGPGEDIAFADTKDAVKDCELLIRGTYDPVFIDGMLRNVQFLTDANDSPPFGTNDNEIIFGLAGDDSIGGGGGTDTIDGGSGQDSIGGGSETDFLIDDDGKPGDALDGDSHSDFIFSADGAEDDIDCGVADGFIDIVFVDSSDNLQNCATDLVHVDEDDDGERSDLLF